MKITNTQELINALVPAFPNATIGEESDGQIVIYTNMHYNSDGSIVEYDDENGE